MEEKFIITEIKRVVMVGKDEYEGDLLRFSNELAYNEIIFHFSGHATVYFDGLSLETHPNTIRFLPRGRTANYEVLRHERGECIMVAFAADRPISPCAFVLDVTQKESLGPLFKRLFSVWVGKRENCYFESMSLLYKIFATLQSKRPTVGRHERRIKPALDLIHDRFLSESLSVSRLAALCDMKESYFQRLFKERCGISPKKYIIRLKINHAAELLRMEHYSVTQVAELSNFSDVYFFSRQFKEYMGVSPTAFVEKYRSSK